MKNFGIKSETVLDFLNGKVRTVNNKSFDIKDGIKVLDDNSDREYNSDGKRTKSVYFDKSGNIRLRQLSKFDNDGNKVGYINYNSEDILDSIGKYELDQKGRIKSKFYNGEIEETYEYDSENNITVVLYPSTGGRNLYEYDNNGLAVRQISLSGENSLFASFFGGPKNKSMIFINDHMGNITELKVYNSETKNLISTKKSIFNIQGDEIETIVLNEDNLEVSYVKYIYKYDNFSNWIFKQTLTKENLVYKEQERIITYYIDNNKKDVQQIMEEYLKDVWRFKKLNGQQLGLLSMALSNKLFPVPKKGQLLVEESFDSNTGIILYFEDLYFKQLISTIRKAYESGAFAKSNAEDDWINLMDSIESAKPEPNFDSKSLRPHYLSAD